MIFSARAIQPDDIPPLIDYWLDASEEFLRGMGADIHKIPPREEWEKMLREQISQRLDKKKSYCIIWLADNKPVGHSNVNKIVFGEEAYMHLHLWNAGIRKAGMGAEFLKLTIPIFFKDLQLENLYCEPYALNPAPNKTLAKLGFRFIKEYITTPGWLNFEQPVNLWLLTREDFKNIYEHRTGV